MKIKELGFILLWLVTCVFVGWFTLHTRCEPCTVWTGPDSREPGFIWRGANSGPTTSCTPCRYAQSQEAYDLCKTRIVKATN